jgi:hypothetical protein
MIEEKEFKKELINRLNTINPGWIDGDRDNTQNKKVDIVNHSLKIAIEIKDDTRYKIEIPTSGVMVSGGEDLDKMNKRFTDHLRSANNKFKEYSDYKTILLIRTEFQIVDIIRYSIDGLHQYGINSQSKSLVYKGRKSKYSEFIRKEIGCYLIVNRDFYFVPNKFARNNRIFNKKELEEILGLGVKDVVKI